MEAVSDRDTLIADLERVARRHGWNATRTTLGYYKLRLSREEGTISIRVSPTGRLSEVTVDLYGQHYQLSLPARTALEELLARPAPRVNPLTDAEKLDMIRRWMHPGLWSGLDNRREAFLRILAGEPVEPPHWDGP
jgi:hypothetical protein